jgi:hypothetical protein
MRGFATPAKKRSGARSPSRRQVRPSVLTSLSNGLQRAAVRRILGGLPLPPEKEPSQIQARLKVRAPGFRLEEPVDLTRDTTVDLPDRSGNSKGSCQNLDTVEDEIGVGARAVSEQLGSVSHREAVGRTLRREAPGDGPAASQPASTPTTAPATPSCKYRRITVSHQDAWKNYPAFAGGGKKSGPFVSSNPDWVAGRGSMVHRFVLTIDVAGDPNGCRYKQENKHKVVRKEGTPNEVVDSDRARHDDTYSRTSSWIRFVGSKIQWMDSPGYPANLTDSDPPVHQTWTFWYSAWDSDGTGPLELELSYDFTARTAGDSWSIGYTPGVPHSVSR